MKLEDAFLFGFGVGTFSFMSLMVVRVSCRSADVVVGLSNSIINAASAVSARSVPLGIKMAANGAVARMSVQSINILILFLKTLVAAPCRCRD